MPIVGSIPTSSANLPEPDQWVICSCHPKQDENYPYAEHHAADCPACLAQKGQLVIPDKGRWHYYFGHLVMPPAWASLAWAKKLHKYQAPVVFESTLRNRLGAYFSSWRYDWDKFKFYWHGYHWGAQKQPALPLLTALYRVLKEKYDRS